jgi:hypothetical protein
VVATLRSLKVELLYFDGCPGYAELRPRLERLLAQRGLLGELVLVPVTTAEQAEERQFLGSPTVRVDSRDIEPAANDRRDFGMKCRLYSTLPGGAHAPTDELILSALEHAS